MKHPLIVGAHMSIAGGYEEALASAESIGATTMQIFTVNQRQWQHKEPEDKDVEVFRTRLAASSLKYIMSHDSYLINLGSPKEDVREKSICAFRQEVERCFRLNISLLNFHPGAALDGSRQECLERIVDSLLSMASLWEKREGQLRLLLEITAGQGSVVGNSFEELQYIIERTNKSIPIGVCLDTCHAFAAGYDLRSNEALHATLDQFDQIIGLDRLFALHMNDSQKGLGCKIDRHMPLGEGMIGLDGFRAIVRHPVLSRLPMYLETPGGLELWKKEIALLHSFTQQ